MNVFDEWEAERLAAMNTPEALAREAAEDAARRARPCVGGCGKTRFECACPEPIYEECEICGAVVVPGCVCDQCGGNPDWEEDEE